MSAKYTERPVRFGMLGAGMICRDRLGYLPNIGTLKDKVEVVAVADIVPERARAVAEEFGIPDSYASLDDMLAQADLDVVVNLTPIPVHAATSLQVVQAGKHLVSEKPLATTLAEADAIIDAAREQGVTIVCAPPDALQARYRTARNVIDRGDIGKVAFARVRSSHAGPGGGPRGWPMDPSWFYQKGSGPLLDMGVYGIHEITALLGPARRVVAFSGITEPTRTVRGDGPFGGTVIDVTADDNSLFMLDFGGATFAVVDGTFNVHAAKSPKVEVFARKGALAIHQRTESGPPLEVYRQDLQPGVDGWDEPANYTDADDPREEVLHRAMLLEHMVDCLREGRTPLASAEHARHALEIMIAVMQSSEEARVIDLQTTF